MLRGEHKLCGLNRGGRTGSGGEGEAGGGGEAETENRQRIVELRSRFRPVQISPPRVPGSSDEAVRLPSPSPRTGCSLCSSPPHKAQLPVYKPHCHLLASTLPLPPLPLCSHVCLRYERCEVGGSVHPPCRRRRLFFFFLTPALLMRIPVCHTLS